MDGLSLCAGVGGLDIGIDLALDGGLRIVGYVEREAFAAAVLVARMEDKALGRAPVSDDVRTFDGRPYRGKVDLVFGGYPCQPFSVAGKQLGSADPRHLWPEFARIVCEVGCRFVFLENVRGHVSLGLSDVLGNLADIGFDAEWGCFSSADAGAPHRRERVFVFGWRRDVADSDCTRLEKRQGVAAHDDEKWSTAERSRREWRACYPPGPWGDWSEIPTDAKPAVCRAPTGVADRVDRIRSAGNGVDPLVAAYAFRTLSARSLTQ